MDTGLYSRKVDDLVKLLKHGYADHAARRYEELLDKTTVSPQALESTIKSRLFQLVGPRIDVLWTDFRVARDMRTKLKAA